MSYMAGREQSPEARPSSLVFVLDHEPECLRLTAQRSDGYHVQLQRDAVPDLQNHYVPTGEANGSQDEVHASDTRLKPQRGVLFLGSDCKAQFVMPVTLPQYSLPQ